MRKTVLTSSIIKCKQVLAHKVAKSHLDELLQSLLKEGYDWASHPDDYNVFIVNYGGESGIGVNAAFSDGGMVCTDLRDPDVQGFYLDDRMVKYIPLSDADLRQYSKLKSNLK